MIDLQQAERQLNDYGMKSFEQLLPSSIDVVSPKDDGVPLSDGKLWHVSDGLLNQARDEVENIRRSLAPDSASDNASIRDQVSRHSRRTSKLLEGPQKRLSQRWSTKSPPLSCDNLPTHTDECRPSTDSAFILTDQNLQSLKVKNDLTQVNDYRIFRQWLLQQPYKARVHIMEALLRDASVTRTKEQSKPQSTSAQGITIKAVHVSQDKSGISAQCVLVLWAVHKQWKKHCDSFPINESWKSKFGLAIDLRKRGLHSLSWKVVDMLHHRLTEKLKLSWNRLATLPENMFLCSYLRHLDLSHNKFKEIPESILCLRFLTHLDMCENQLCSIPDDISRLESLKSLLVANNNIRVIPPAIGKMRSLVLLNYDYNPVLVPSQHTKDLSQSYEAIRDDSHAAFDSSRTARLKLVLNTQNDYSKLTRPSDQNLLVTLLSHHMYISTNWHN
jgi:Leucine-rich repeat (LRR) protein